MKTSTKMLSLGSVFMLFALMTSSTVIIRGTAVAADETFSATAIIRVPNAGFLPLVCGPTATNPFCLSSFDIGLVDAQIGRYFLADRTNKTIDQVVTSTNAISQLAPGSFVGVQAHSNTSGPNGVIT